VAGAWVKKRREAQFPGIKQFLQTGQEKYFSGISGWFL
jgi:hypothetical protein